MTVYALILAAGASTRMGRCKASLPWLKNHTLLTYQLQQWRRVEVTPIVIVNPDNLAQITLPRGTQVVVNSQPAAGKTRSIVLGLQAVPLNFTGLAIAAVDQPRPAWVYAKLLAAYHQGQAKIVAPSHQGRLGHPLVFAPEMRPHLEKIQEKTLGLRQIMQTFAAETRGIELGTEIVRLDLNTPEEYQQQLAHPDWLNRPRSPE